METTNKDKGTILLKERIRNSFRPFFSLAISAVGCFLMSLCNVMAKKLSNVSVFCIIVTRFAVMGPLAMAIILYRNHSIYPKGKRLQLSGRALLGTCGNTIGFCALRYMPLGDLSMISSTSTFFVCLSAWIFLKEPIDKLNLLNIIFVVSGLIMIVQPPFIFSNENQLYSENPMAIYFAVAAMFSAIFVQPNVMVLLRSLKDVPFATVLLNFCIVGFINGILMLVFNVYYENKEVMGGFPKTSYEWIIVLLIGVLSFIGQATLTIGLQIEAAGAITLMRKAFSLIFAYTFQVTLFEENPNAYGIGGAVLICFSLILSSVKKVLEEKPNNDYTVKRKYL